MEALQRLIEEAAIQRLKARYFRCMDTRDWEGFAAVLTDDIELRHDQAVGTVGFDPGEPQVMRGKQQVLDRVAAAVLRKQTVHHGHMAEIDLRSDREAKGTWAMASTFDVGHTIIRMAGHYHETYRKVDGEWRIATIHLTALRYEQLSYDRIVNV